MEKIKKLFIRILFVLAFFMFIFLFLDIQVRPIVRDYSKAKVNLMSIDIINESILSYLSTHNITYKDLVDVKTDSNNNITSLDVNSININKMKSEVSMIISKKLNLIDKEFLKIPLGTLIGINILSGRGPLIAFDIAPVGDVISNLEHNFNSVGINQSKHQITMNIKVKMMSTIPGYKSYYNVNTNFVIAETVIIGKVPNTYFNVEDKNYDFLNNFKDYKVFK